MRFAVHAVMAVLCTLLGWPAIAAEFPSRPIRIVVPYAPGGTSDVIGRLIGQSLSRHLGQPVIVENRPGANEQIGGLAVVRSEPDGHTLLLATHFGLAISPSLYPRMQYDPAKDLVPVAALARSPNVVAVNPSVPAKNMTELTDYLKRNPGKISYGGAGPPLTLELYKRAAGIDAIYVQYKGGSPAMQDLMAGNIQIMMAQLPEIMPLIKSGKVRGVAVTSSSRLSKYPDLAPVSEVPGMQDLESYAWYAMVAPARTPPEVIGKLNGAINAALNDPSVRERLAGMDIESLGGSPERLATVLRAESSRWKKVIDEAGIKVE